MAGSGMPEFTKPPQALVQVFAQAIDGLPETEPRKMFGYPAAFSGGQLAAGVFQDRVMARLSPEDRARALELPGAEPTAVMPGHPMKEYVTLPRELSGDPARLREWIARAAEYTRTLPPKKKKKR